MCISSDRRQADALLRARGRLTHPLALPLLAHLTAKAHVVATTFIHILGLATGRGPEAAQAGGCKIALDPSRAASLRARGRLTHPLALPLLSHVTEKTLVVAATVVHIFGSPTGRGHDHGLQKWPAKAAQACCLAVSEGAPDPPPRAPPPDHLHCEHSGRRCSCCASPRIGTRLRP